MSQYFPVHKTFEGDQAFIHFFFFESVHFTDKIEKLTYIDGKSDWIDLRAAEEVELKAGEFKLIHLGVAMQLPEGYEAQMRPRSGLALKHGITLLNTPGTIDADYRGEIGIILVNLSSEPFTVNDGERICQMVIAAHSHVDWELSLIHI